jgi:quinol monooxygenase YgiN
MNDTPLILNVHMQALAGRERELETELRALLEPTRNEPGCMAYELHKDPENPAKFMFYEKFKNQAALDLHLDSPHFKRFMAYRQSGVDPVATAMVTRWTAIV